jgi:16S rRNA (guanine527-N7)-methyltransferase
VSEVPVVFGPSDGWEAEAAREYFGDRLPYAVRYAELLGSAGIERGLLGPREVSRLWPRHLLNCAALTELVSRETRVVDVGTGAGLPGLVLALARPDIRVDLVESLQRRVDFLHEVVADLDLGEQVRVIRGRAEDAGVRAIVGGAPYVTARAVAPLDRLVKWCLPLLAPEGELLALKGATAGDELAEHLPAVRRAGGVGARIEMCGARLDESVPVIVIARGKGTR